jgi:hypothetical protein
MKKLFAILAAIFVVGPVTALAQFNGCGPGFCNAQMTLTGVGGFRSPPGGNILLTNLTSYWKLDESSGNALDANSTNVLIDNGTVGATAGGIINGARTFNGSTQYFNVASNASLDVGATDFSFTCWVKLTTVASLQALISKRAGGAAGQYVLYYDNGTSRFDFFVYNGTTFIGATANTFGLPSTGTWYFLAVVVDDTAKTIKISVNAGAQDTSASYTTSIPSRTDAFQIGAEQIVAQNFLNGAIDEVGFWKRKLTTAEITQLYNSGAGYAYSNFH